MKLDKITNSINRIAIIGIGILTSLIMLFLTFESFIHTVDMNMNNAFSEQVEYFADNIWLNILYIAVFVLLFFLLKKAIKKIPMWCAYAFCAVWTLVWGIIVVYSVRSAPTHDSQFVSYGAYAAANGDYTHITGVYFDRFPYQLGYVFFNEILVRLFHLQEPCFLILEVVNVIFLAGANLCLITIIDDIFSNKDIAKLSAVLISLCVQPILFSTFLYGNIPGFAFAMASVMLMLKYYKTNKYVYLILSPILLGLSVAVKLNNIIVFVALAIIFVLMLITRRKLADIAFILIAVVMVFGLNNLLIAQYSARADHDYGSGIPKICWLYMGISEGGIENGWFNYYCYVDPYEINNQDSEKTSEYVKGKIDERLDDFSDAKYATNFFYKKIVSQWNEPTYQSIWTNQVRGFYDEPNAIGEFIIDSGEDFLKEYMDAYQLIIYLGMLIYCIYATMQKDIRKMILPLIVLGGFIYHCLFEAKSQYCVTYFQMMIPCAAVAYYQMVQLFENKYLTKGKAVSVTQKNNKKKSKKKRR